MVAASIHSWRWRVTSRRRCDRTETVEAHYYEGGGHNTFFTNSTQRDDELKTMITFLRRHLGA
jgi:alpha-beta hydrolase superfamily lysophospholipase